MRIDARFYWPFGFNRTFDGVGEKITRCRFLVLFLSRWIDLNCPISIEDTRLLFRCPFLAPFFAAPPLFARDTVKNDYAFEINVHFGWRSGGKKFGRIDWMSTMIGETFGSDSFRFAIDDFGGFGARVKNMRKKARFRLWWIAEKLFWSSIVELEHVDWDILLLEVADITFYDVCWFRVSWWRQRNELWGGKNWLEARATVRLFFFRCKQTERLNWTDSKQICS